MMDPDAFERRERLFDEYRDALRKVEALRASYTDAEDALDRLRSNYQDAEESAVFLRRIIEAVIADDEDPVVAKLQHGNDTAEDDMAKSSFVSRAGRGSRVMSPYEIATVGQQRGKIGKISRMLQAIGEIWHDR